MNQCTICGKDCKGKTCSGACRAKLSRRTTKAHETEAHTPSARLALPGDIDYVGVCEKVDGHWRVKDSPQPETVQCLTQSMVDSLPTSVSKPTGQPSTATQAMTAQELHSRVSTYKGTAWIGSEEYSEIIHRLLTMTDTELEQSGQRIPQWKEQHHGAWS